MHAYLFYGLKFSHDEVNHLLDMPYTEKVDNILKGYNYSLTRGPPWFTNNIWFGMSSAKDGPAFLHSFDSNYGDPDLTDDWFYYIGYFDKHSKVYTMRQVYRRNNTFTLNDMPGINPNEKGLELLEVCQELGLEFKEPSIYTRIH